MGEGSGGGFSVGDSSQDTHGILEFHWHFLLEEEMQKRGNIF